VSPPPFSQKTMCVLGDLLVALFYAYDLPPASFSDLLLTFSIITYCMDAMMRLNLGMKLDPQLVNILHADLPVINYAKEKGYVSNGEIDLYSMLEFVGVPRPSINNRVEKLIKKLPILGTSLSLIKVGGEAQYMFGVTDAVDVLEKIIRSELIGGYGINDIPQKITGEYKICYEKWRSMLRRCYREEWHIYKPSYSGCSVAKEWFYFSNFMRWHNENYTKGHVLDKDIIIKGNKHYSPKTCVYVPEYVNSLLISRTRSNRELPSGVFLLKSDKVTPYNVKFELGKKKMALGRFISPEEAFLACKKVREKHIRTVAEKAFDKGEISLKSFNALCRHQVEVGD